MDSIEEDILKLDSVDYDYMCDLIAKKESEVAVGYLTAEDAFDEITTALAKIKCGQYESFYWEV